MSDHNMPPTSPRARKEHVCVYCGGPIVVGERYMQQTGFYDGAAYRSRYHVECWDILISEGGEWEITPGEGEYPERVRAIVETRRAASAPAGEV